MATMASTSHGLSAWANTCIKSPIDPKTGLNYALHDRDTLPIRYDCAFKEVEDNAVLFNTIDLLGKSAASSSVCDELRMSTEGEFYEKLQQLKEENKKTIEAFERLYQDKMLIESVRSSKSYEFKPDKSGIDTKASIDSMELSVKGVGTHSLRKPEQTIVGKPPPAKRRESPLQTPIPSKTLPQQSTHTSKLERPGSAPMERSHSLDHEYWHRAFSGLRGSNENFIIPLEDKSDEYEKALAKVDKLWEDFKISEYVQRRHSFSSSGHENEKSEGIKTKTSEWRHRITIPQPFKMSIREALKEKKKTSAQEELDQKRLEKQKQEEAECEKKFKAQPVPAHVYLPKFEEIMERNESRRKYVKQICQELLQSQVKPFKFESREQDKKLQRAQSAPVRRAEKIHKNFIAKPVPRHIFSQDIDEKFLEEDELRKIRVKMRSKELLRESSLPPSMAAREKLKEQERKEKVKMSKLAAKKRRPKSIHDIPDYNALYNEFKNELARRRSMQKGTVIEPFNLETEQIHSNKDKIRQDIEDDEKRLKENRWPFQNSRMTPRSSMKYLGALSSSLDYIPTQSTRSVELRSTMTKKDRERLANRQKEEEEAERRRKTREAKLRRFLSEKTNSDEIPNPRDSIAERLKRIRKENRERQEAYEKEIEEINARVEQSPLLVEKYMAENAKRAAEKKFSTALHNAGLNDKEFVSTKSSRSTCVKSGVSYAEDHHGGGPDDGGETPSHPSSGDLTYTKSATDD